ncbi:MAG: ROK family protein [Bacteroidales bacterium]|nr:ROK family protein [Bacteroidales bacterium]
MKKVAIGIDIGGTNTVLGIVDRDGNLLSDISMPTQTKETIEEYVSDLVQKINSLIKSSKDKIEIVGIGIGAPNGNYHKGTIEHAANLRWKGIIPFVNLVKKHYNVPVALTNDANAAAIGEMIYGAAKGMKDFVVITLGTGLGSGLVVNGELVYGHDGFAGEIGHTLVYPDGRQCGCSKKGCLETYVSATGMVRTMSEILCNSNKPSSLRDIPYNQLTSLSIQKALEAGDELAKECFEYTGKILGMKLADTVAHTSPEAIFLFGGMAKAGDLLIKPTIKSMEENLLPIFRNKVKILLSGLLDVNAAILGAGALIWNEIEK